MTNINTAGRIGVDALEVALYSAYATSVDCGRDPATGRQFPRYHQLDNDSKARWRAVAKLAYGAADGIVFDLIHHLATQAGAYPWTGGSVPPCAAEPEPDAPSGETEQAPRFRPRAPEPPSPRPRPPAPRSRSFTPPRPRRSPTTAPSRRPFS